MCNDECFNFSCQSIRWIWLKHVRINVTEQLNNLDLFVTGFPHILESTWIFSAKFKALKVLENRTGAWRYLNFIPQVLESPWMHQVKLRYQQSLNNICVGLVAVSASSFVKLIDCCTSCWHHVSCLQHGLSICQVFCLQDLLIVVMFCFYQLKLYHNHRNRY